MQKKTLQVLVLALLLGALIFPARLAVRAEDTCPPPTPVTIDIKPGSSRNPINLTAQGTVPVAVITTADFDASLFTPEMAHLADANTAMDNVCSGAVATRWVRLDVNADGRADLVFYFQTQDLNFTTATTAATFMAHGMYGSTTVHIMGTDSVTVIH